MRGSRITYDAQKNFLFAHNANFHTRGHTREDRRHRERDTVKEIKQKLKAETGEDVAKRGEGACCAAGSGVGRTRGLGEGYERQQERIARA